MDKNQRIKVAIKWLISSGVAKNQESLGKLLGYSNKSSFSQVVNGKVALPNDFIDRICALDNNINSNWLSNGSGSMLDKSNLVNEVHHEYNIVCDECKKKERLIEKLNNYITILESKLSDYEKTKKQTG